MKALLAAVFLALALPAAAAAHANLVRLEPPNGAVLARPPAAVRVTFDDVVRVGPGIEAVRNGGASVLAGRPFVERARTLVVPLRRGLADGAYSVRWAIVSDDGHLESGVLAFAVGLGRPRPLATLGAEATGPQPPGVVERWLFFAGLLGAVGMAFFALATGTRGRRVIAVVGAAALVCALGAALQSHAAGLSTRAGLALAVGAGWALLVAVVAGGAARERRAAVPALVLAVGLLPVPTVAGHALDPGLSRVNVAADILHVAGAAAWVGALGGLVVARRRAFGLALGGVVLLAVTGVVRAGFELVHVAQLWDTSYGNALLAKTGLLAVALALGLRRRPRIELVLVAGVLVGVSVLVLERPGRNVVREPVAAAAVPAEPQPPPPAPPPDAVVVAHELGVYGVALAVEPRRETVIVLSPAGGGASGLDVAVDGRRASRCGSGCYRTEGPHSARVTVSVAGQQTSFPVPAHARDASALVRRLRRRYRSLRSVAYVEHLASDPTHAVTAYWRLQAPDRIAYVIPNGAQAVVVGPRRWDRVTPTGRWVESPQTPLPQPATQWTVATNAHLLRAGVVSFVGPDIPAYFTVSFDPRTLRPRVLHMTAAAHFMTDRYVRFDSGPAIRPPR